MGILSMCVLDFREIQCYKSGKKFLEQLEELM